MDSDATRWRKPGGGMAVGRADILRQRHVIRRAARDYLDAKGYLQIDAPLLVRGTTPDPAVESFRVGADRYLCTSTEYQMKRLACGGFDAVYSLTQNFREGDSVGPLRNPEFTMLEWGRVGVELARIEEDAEGFILAAMQALGLGTSLSYAGRRIDMSPPWERLSVADAIAREIGRLFHGFDLENCRSAAEALGITIHGSWAEDRDFLFSLVMTEIQPRLGSSRPIFLRDWPFYETTSARARADELIADRSELFIGGIEIADGFAAQADAQIQEMLFEHALARRKAAGQPTVELDQRYLEAMRGTDLFGAGMALGFDRIVMLLTGQTHIRNVLAFAWDEL